MLICYNNRFLFLILSFLLIFPIKTELLFVYEHVRHGARGPSSEYNSLFNNKTFYDEFGLYWGTDGLLTTFGKMQHFILGLRNRIKYPNLLNYTKFNPEEILIHVTKSHRVKESAYNHLFGMFGHKIKISENDIRNKQYFSLPKIKNTFFYPPNIEWWLSKTNMDIIDKIILNEAELIINNNISKNIFKDSTNDNNISLYPFLTQGNFNISLDNKLNFIFSPYKDNRTFFKRKCINHKEYIKSNQKGKYMEYIKSNLEKNYGKKLQKFFGYKNKEWLYDIHHSFSIIDHYIVNIEAGKHMSKFLNVTGFDEMEFYKLSKKIYKYWLFHVFCDEYTCTMESSRLMEDLIEYFDNKITEKNNKLKMVIDFGHDVTVAPMQLFMYSAFGVDVKVCSFSCNVYFELHKDNGNFIVKYFIDDELRLTKEYKEFKDTVKKIIWSKKQTEEFCTGNIFKILYPNLFRYIWLIFFIVILLLLGCIGKKIYYITYFKEKRNCLIDKNEKNTDKDKELDSI